MARPIADSVLPCGCSWPAGAGPEYGAECAAVKELVERVHDDAFSPVAHDGAWEAFYDHFRTPPAILAPDPGLSRVARCSPSILDWGARGDGVTDDTVAFQNALEAGQMPIYVPRGRYRLKPLPAPFEVNAAGLMMSAEELQAILHPSATAAVVPDPYCTPAVLPSALTQTELEALKRGPLPRGEGMMEHCDECRLRPPNGWRNEAGTYFICDLCYSRKVKK